MTMNETAILTNDLLLVLGAVAVSFILGGIHRLGRTVSRERQVVEPADRDLRELSDRCERQQLNMTRLSQEINDMRQALMQQAMTMAPVHAALHASVPAPVQPPAAQQATPHPAATRPGAATLAQAATTAAPVKSDPLKLARAGAGPEVLMARCRLSRAEAELVISVHGTKARPAAA